VNVGLLGGSFDPVHVGHLIVGQEAADVLGLDALYFVPCRLPPHKPDRTLASAHHRLRMLVDSSRDNPRFAVSDVELNRAGPSYSVDTLRAFREILGARSALYFVVGMDSLVDMRTWRTPETIFDIATVVAVSRPGFRWEDAPAGFREKAVPLDLTQVDVSSSRVRRFVREGRSIRYLVPPGVAGYIQREGLYR
jgi:nicotinate-nucleotide adenylyltransferase